jgi:hypothetical protein
VTLIYFYVHFRMLEGSHGDGSNASSDGGPQFAEVFVIYWVGAMVVTPLHYVQYSQRHRVINHCDRLSKTYITHLGLLDISFVLKFL